MASTESHTWPHIPGYTIVEQIYWNFRTAVYRAVQAAQQRPVVIKVLQQEYPSFNELVQFRNQYTIAKNLPIPGIVRPLSLEPWQNSYAMVMEEFESMSLRQYAQEHSLSLPEILAIAVQMAQILNDLCQHRVVHKDIKPANILINPQSHEIKLIDFSIASLLPKGTQEPKNPTALEGTLAYLPPEQTGRMNRGIDYRADFYSLGVTLFELLTGQLPFESTDPMELVYCHLAQQPPRADSINPEVPAVVAEIVGKLMSKNAEDRYQSSLGLKQDLECCLKQWQETGRVERFELGLQDRCDRFLIPEKLYGRENEIRTLLNAFDRVAVGNTELMLVSGFSGIGKTVVVNELYKPIVRQRAYFIKGKFDQFNCNIPFSAFVQAFRSLMGQLLAESDADLASWKAQILDAVGENGQVITDVIPELERIIGQQPPVVELSGGAAQNRFNLVFGKFVCVFATKEHPLVIFLDDLQWADSASLNLLKLLMDKSEAGYLLMLGAYRNNEVFPAHGLMLTLDELHKQGANINTLTLAPLGRLDITRLIADTLLCSTEIAAPLSQLIYQKTQGNPFFTTQFLKGLYEDGYITFEAKAGYWQCDLTQVRQLALTDDVVSFMVERLRKLPEVTQEALKLAACIGNRFDLVTLAVVCERSQEEVATDLWTGLQEGFVVPESETYKFFQGDERSAKNVENVVVGYHFVHDRVQQAAYSMIQDERKPATHLKIGKLLLEKTPPHQQESRIFEIVNQLNIGLASPENLVEPSEFLRLNCMAGKRAKEATAYEAAASYFESAKSLLPLDSWCSSYKETLEIYFNLAEVKYLDGDFKSSEELIEIISESARDPIERAEAYNLLVIQYTMQGKFQEALDSGQKALAFLDFELSEHDAKEKILAFKEESDIKLAGRRAEDLVNEPECQIPEKSVAIKILNNLLVPTYVLQKEDLYFVVTLSIVCLSLTYGVVAESGYGFSSYGMFLGSRQGDYKSGYRFGELAVNLAKRFGQAYNLCRACYVLGNNLLSWVRPLRCSEPIFNEGFLAGLESGELIFAGNILMYKVLNPFFAGENIYGIQQNAQEYIKIASKTINYQLAADVISGLDIWLANLTASEVESNLNEEQYVANCVANNSMYAVCHYLILKTKILTFYGAYDESLKASQKAEEIINVILGKYQVAALNFYQSIALIGLCRDPQSEAIKDLYLEKVRFNQAQLEVWAAGCAENFTHKYYLVNAELASFLGNKERAIDLYDCAIAGAKENCYLQEEGLANELAAKFYLAWGKEKVAASYMQEAYYCYARWGAKAKTNQLEAQYPQLLTPILQQSEPIVNLDNPRTTTPTVSTVTQTSFVLDLASAIKASQALSQEIELKALLSKLMLIILENAGADKGALILNNSGTWEIAAQCFSGNCYLSTIPLDQTDNLPSSIINTVKRTQQNLLINNIDQDKTFTRDPYFNQNQPKSILCFPLINQGQSSGIVYLENNLAVGAFTSERLEVLRLLSAQAAISITNAKLYAEVKESQSKLTQFLNAMPVGVSVHEPNGQLYYANQAAQELLGINALPQAKTEQLVQAYQVYRAGTNEIYPTDQLPIVRSLNGERVNAEDLELHQPNHIIPVEISTTPIWDETGKIIYAIAAFQDITSRKQAEKLIAEYNCTLEAQVKERTAQLALANQEITALNERLKAENLRMSAELEVTKQLQQMILPKPKELESIKGLEIAGFMEPADEVGGDYYDVLQQDGKVKIGIGDVTGHGLESGMLMLMTQTAITTLQESNQTDPVQFLDILNRTIYRNVQRINSHKNLTLAVLEYADNTLTISGQHEEIIVVRAGGIVERIDTLYLGFPIGLDKDIADFVAQEQVQLNSGDVVVLYTDGISEAFDINHKEYGIERLCEVVSLNWERSAQEIQQAVIEDVRRHIGSQKVFDDITLVVLKQN